MRKAIYTLDRTHTTKIVIGSFDDLDQEVCSNAV
jgi:hypothetical protein